jgi:KDO2-lipid IV(A) lauroyltransferase
MTTYLLYRLVAFIANNCSRSFGSWLSLRTADINYFLNRKSRDGARANLRVILGEDVSDAHRLYALRWVFRCFGKYMFEFLGNRRFDAAFFDRCVTYMGLEHIAAARAAGNGAVLASAHFGNWELGAAAMSFRGTPVLSIIQDHPNPLVHRFYMRLRERRNYQVVSVGEAARPVLRHLRDNGLVAVVADRPYGEVGIPVEFFGHQVLFPAGPARLALTTGAPFIPGFVLRRWDDSFLIFFDAPLTAPAGLPKEERIHRITQAFARRLEQLVRENPTQWPTFYPIFARGGRPEERGI